MQNYQDMGDNYEPSADELIDVLKNLENLAAVNPALYRAIVDQIKGKSWLLLSPSLPLAVGRWFIPSSLSQQLELHKRGRGSSNT